MKTNLTHIRVNLHVNCFERKPHLGNFEFYSKSAVQQEGIWNTDSTCHISYSRDSPSNLLVATP